MEIKKPNFLIIGSAKCGTTSLAAILDEHPAVCMSRPKEASFFQDTFEFKQNPNFDMGWSWYSNFFTHYNGEKLVGEATPSYSDRTRSPKTAQRIYEFNPDMKLIYMVRNPIERQISAWKMDYYFYTNNLINRQEVEWSSKGFEYWLEQQEKVKQWDECRYLYQTKAYLDFFPEKNLCVSFLDDWKINQKKEVERILNFLHIDSFSIDPMIKQNQLRDSGGDNKLSKAIKNSFLWTNVKKMIPYAIKKRIYKKVGEKKIQFPVINYKADILHEFTLYIQKDNDEFLAKYDKQDLEWSINP